MGTGAVFLLGVIAVATAAIAASQIALFIVLGRLARRMERMTERVEHEIRPLVASATAVADNAARATALAAAQVQRADRAIAQLAARADETAAVFQKVLEAPAREGRALLAGVAAAIAAFRELREASARTRALRAEEEDPLFIG